MLFQKILQPLTYIEQIPAKKIRQKVIHAFNYWLKVPADKLNELADIIMMVHNSSLL
jgi:geranylgeranyl diphosphate synthase type 3